MQFCESITKQKERNIIVLMNPLCFKPPNLHYKGFCIEQCSIALQHNGWITLWLIYFRSKDKGKGWNNFLVRHEKGRIFYFLFFTSKRWLREDCNLLKASLTFIYSNKRLLYDVILSTCKLPSYIFVGQNSWYWSHRNENNFMFFTLINSAVLLWGRCFNQNSP